jgi:MFS family permease
MAAGRSEPVLASSYSANVVLVVLSLFPGLINTSAVALAGPVIGRDLGVAPNVAASIPLISDAALAFGCVLAAELTRRIEGRTLYFWLIGVSALSSLASALAPSYGVLLAAHVVHGLVAGMLFVTVLPPLLTNFKSDKLGATASVMVPCLFGAATLGPLTGGLVSGTQVWRLMFGAEVFVAVAAMVLARRTLAKREPQGSDQPVDWYALIAAGLGSALVYVGVGGFAGNSWRDPFASIPLLVGLLIYAALIVGEARKEHPLVPVRKLATSLALVGTVATVIGSMTFNALAQSFQLSLLRVDGLDPRATGLAFWPEFIAAVGAGYLFGRIVTTKLVVLSGAAGLAFIALAAVFARVAAPVDVHSAGWLSLIAAFGAGLSVSPGLFLIALSFERALLGRAIALLNLFRLTGGFISAPGVEHTIGSSASTQLTVLAPAIDAPSAERMMRAFVTGQDLPAGQALAPLQQALTAGIDDAYSIVLTLAVVGIIVIAILLLAGHVPLRTPDLEQFDEGEPALEVSGFHY